MPEDEVLKWDRQSKLFLSLCTEEEKSPAEDKDDSVMERPFSVSKAVFTVIVHIVFLGGLGTSPLNTVGLENFG